MKYVFAKIYSIASPVVVILIVFLSLGCILYLALGKESIAEELLLYEALAATIYVILQISIRLYVLQIIEKKRKEREQHE